MSLAAGNKVIIYINYQVEKRRDYDAVNKTGRSEKEEDCSLGLYTLEINGSWIREQTRMCTCSYSDTQLVQLKI